MTRVALTVVLTILIQTDRFSKICCSYVISLIEETITGLRRKLYLCLKARAFFSMSSSPVDQEVVNAAIPRRFVPGVAAKDCRMSGIRSREVLAKEFKNPFVGLYKLFFYSIDFYMIGTKIWYLSSLSTKFILNCE